MERGKIILEKDRNLMLDIYKYKYLYKFISTIRIKGKEKEEVLGYFELNGEKIEIKRMVKGKDKIIQKRKSFLVSEIVSEITGRRTRKIIKVQENSREVV